MYYLIVNFMRLAQFLMLNNLIDYYSMFRTFSFDSFT